MDYRKVYKNLVESRFNNRDNIRSLGYELHHILPRSLGGGDTNDNLVKLTYKEHILAHRLLCKFTTGVDRYKMLTAYLLISGVTKYLGKDKSLISRALITLAKRKLDYLPYAPFHKSIRKFKKSMYIHSFLTTRVSNKGGSYFHDVFDLCLYAAIQGYKGLQSTSVCYKKLPMSARNALKANHVVTDEMEFTGKFKDFALSIYYKRHRLENFSKRINECSKIRPLLNTYNSKIKMPTIACIKLKKGLYSLEKLTNIPTSLDEYLYEGYSIKELSKILKSKF